MPTDILEKVEERKKHFPEGRFVILHPDDWLMISGCMGLLQCCQIVDGAYAICGLQVMIDGSINRGVTVVR